MRCEDAEKSELDRITGGNHQGVAAFVPPYRYSSIDEILGLAERKGEPPFVIILNNIEDPQNLGAVMRSAEGAGAHGIIIAKDRSSGVTQSAIRVSAGAAEYVKCARVANISAAIEKLKKSGLWIYACDMGGEPYWDHDLTGGAGIVIGNEGKGIRRLVREKCDFTLSVPMCGRIQSLNAANAATVIMYEARRQRSR